MSVVIICIVTLVSQFINKVNGVGPAISKTYSLEGFALLDAAIEADVYYTQADFYSVEILAQANIHDAIETKVVNGRLRIQFDKFRNVRQYSRIVIFITAPQLASIGVVIPPLHRHGMLGEVLTEA